MGSPINRWPLGRLAKAAAALLVLLALGAVGGGAALMLGPNGEILPLPLSALRGSPFDSYFVPGLVLFGVLGFGSLGAALLVGRRHPLAPFATSGIGLVLLIWLAVEIAVVGYSNEPPLQPFYLVYGLVLVAVGLAWTADDGLIQRHSHASVS